MSEPMKGKLILAVDKETSGWISFLNGYALTKYREESPREYEENKHVWPKIAAAFHTALFVENTK